ncbi:MAG: hypothetical protein WBP12_00850 [Candidatus Saccharimonas sp.]
MGLFHHKQQTPTDGDENSQEHFFDEYFREELRNHGRWYFEKVINENGELFKNDLQATVQQVNLELKDHITSQLDAAITQLNTELKDHVTKQIDEQLVSRAKVMQEAQDQALKALTDSAAALQEHHKHLSETLEKNVADQDALLHNVFEENKTRITSMTDAQDAALETLKHSIQTLQEQYQATATALQKGVDDQKAMLMNSFQDNMAQVVEHYLLGALGDQYDLKSQLPSIIKQLEANKQAMVDDINL